jgi:hypothetical protein
MICNTMTRQEIEEKMDELAREYYDTTTRRSQKRFMNWLSGLGRALKAPIRKLTRN